MSSPTDHHRLQGLARRNRREPEKKKILARPGKRLAHPSDTGSAFASSSVSGADTASAVSGTSSVSLSAQADGSPSSKTPGRGSVARRVFKILLPLLEILFLVGVFVLTVRYAETERRTLETRREAEQALEELEIRTQEATLEVRYLVPGQKDLTEELLYGDYATLRGPTEIPGYTFLGWEDREGKLEDRLTFPVYRDTVYTARYALAFETEKHIPYLSTDSQGILNPQGYVTMREFVKILYTLLNLDRVGEGRFLDVPKTDSCYKAAATLKDLGVLSGSRLYPDENLTKGDMLEILCSFFPLSDETFVFQDLDEREAYYPYFCTAVAYGWIPSGMLVRAGAVDPVTRGEFARIMNHVLHRDSERDLKPGDVGTILDVPATNDYYDDIVEAVIPHEYRMEDGIEVWTDSEPVPLHKPGYFFSGVRLHYIDENGNAVANGSANGLDFNHNGEVTTGDEELDRMLWDVLTETIQPRKMTSEEMLRAVYDYVVDNFTYLTGRVYEKGAIGWGPKEAKKMLQNGHGNCYNFAALFYELARFVGYDAKLYAGYVYGDQQVYDTADGGVLFAPMGYTPHGWVEITFDDMDYIFDTEYEYRMPWTDMYKCGMATRGQYGYEK